MRRGAGGVLALAVAALLGGAWLLPGWAQGSGTWTRAAPLLGGRTEVPLGLAATGPAASTDWDPAPEEARLRGAEARP